MDSGQNYKKPTKSKRLSDFEVSFELDKYTGNYWFDNGIVILNKKYGDKKMRFSEALKDVMNELTTYTNEKGLYYDKESKEIKEYNKKRWKKPYAYFTSVTNRYERIKLKELPEETRNYLVSHLGFGMNVIDLSPPKLELEGIEFTKDKMHCYVCGEYTYTTEAKSYMWPFAVSTEKYGNIAPEYKGGIRLCPRCVLAGMAAYTRLLWVENNENVIILLFHSDIENLKRIHTEIIDYFIINSNFNGNVKKGLKNVQGAYEFAFAVQLNFFKYISHKRLSEEANNLLGDLLGDILDIDKSFKHSFLDLHLIFGSVDNKYNTLFVKSVETYTDLNRMYKMYEEWTDILKEYNNESNGHNQLLKILNQFVIKYDNKFDTKYRDKLCENIMKGSNIIGVLSEYFREIIKSRYNKKAIVKGTIEIMKRYIAEQLKKYFKVDDAFLEKIETFSKKVGKCIAEKGKLWILYRLNEISNIQDILSVMTEISYALNIYVPREILYLVFSHDRALAYNVQKLMFIFAAVSYLKNTYNKNSVNTE